VGLTEQEVKASGRAYRVGKFPFSANGKARTMGETQGFVKFVVDASTDEILGCQMIGPHVADLLAEGRLAMEDRGSAEDIGITHPVISKIENGRYPNLQLNLLVKLCNHYNVTLQQALSLEVANIFQLTNNGEGHQKLIGQELSSGYELYIQQLINENKFLKEQAHQLIDKLGQ
jgi:transcriptional regulator with XRE-family HTH domain